MKKLKENWTTLVLLLVFLYALTAIFVESLRPSVFVIAYYGLYIHYRVSNNKLTNEVFVLKSKLNVEKNRNSSEVIDFVKWMHDNYSQNVEQGSSHMLPYHQMRKDFTKEIYEIREIYEEYLKR